MLVSGSRNGGVRHQQGGDMTIEIEKKNRIFTIIINSPELADGIERFTGGAGRHGSFDDRG